MFRIKFTDRFGKEQLLEGETYKFREKAIAETLAEYPEGTNNPAWSGSFTVVDVGRDY